MTTINEIMAAATDLGDERIMARVGRSDRDSVREREAELRTIITQAIAEARADGAREMREMREAAEIERLRADAERYRWLKNEHLRYDPVCHLSWKLRMDRDGCQWVNTTALDADIDHAMKEAK